MCLQAAEAVVTFMGQLEQLVTSMMAASHAAVAAAAAAAVGAAGAGPEMEEEGEGWLVCSSTHLRVSHLCHTWAQLALYANQHEQVGRAVVGWWPAGAVCEPA